MRIWAASAKGGIHRKLVRHRHCEEPKATRQSMACPRAQLPGSVMDCFAFSSQ
jgi:hypothetical protein